MKPQTEDLLLMLQWGIETAMFPTWRNLCESYEGWYYRRFLRHQLRSLERRGLIKRDRRARELVYRLTATGRLAADGGRDPQRCWDRPWDGRWRMIIFDLPVGARNVRHQLLRWLRQNGFGYLQDSVWITPDPVGELAETLGGLREDVEAFMVMEARCVSGGSAVAFVNGAWKFPVINRQYEIYLDFLRDNPPPADGDKAMWLQRERELWRRGVGRDPLLPRALWPKDYLGEEAWEVRQKTLRALFRRLARDRLTASGSSSRVPNSDATE